MDKWTDGRHETITKVLKGRHKGLKGRKITAQVEQSEAWVKREITSRPEGPA